MAYRPKRRRDDVPPFDVIMVDDPWLYALVTNPYDPAARRLEDLTSILRKSEGEFFDRTLCVSAYNPGTDCRNYSSWRSTARYYAVPFVANSQVFAYRISDLQSLDQPTTWQKVLEASQAIEQNGSAGYVTRIGPGNSIVTDYMPILWAYDPRSFPERPSDGAVLNSPEAALHQLTQLVATRRNLGSASFDNFDVTAYLQSGQASMGIVWSAWAMALVSINDRVADEVFRQGSFSASMSERVARLSQSLLTKPEDPTETYLWSKKFKEELVFGNVPQVTEAQAEPELGVWMLAIPTNSGKRIEQYETALDFIKYATDLDNDRMPRSHPRGLLAAELGTPSPRKTVWDDPRIKARFEVQHPSLIPAIQWSLAHARARPRTACWKEVEARLGSYLERLVDKSIQPEEITKRANPELQPFFDKDQCRKFLKNQHSR